MTIFKDKNEFPWAHLNSTLPVNGTIPERVQVYLNLFRDIYNDPNIPKIGAVSEVDGNLHLLSFKENESTSPTSPACTAASFGFKISTSYINIYGMLQGSHAAHLIDRVSFLLLAGAARPGLWETSGVSTAMNVYWSRPLALGDDIVIDAEISTFTAKTCVITARLRKQGSDKVAVTGQHHITANASTWTKKKSKL